MRWTVVEHLGQPAPAGLSAWFTAPGGTIGRSPDNHLILPDNLRKISRLQATVRFEPDGTPLLRNMSAVMPIVVNERTLRHNDELELQDGDRVVIGSYVLSVEDQAPPSCATAAPSHEFPLSAHAALTPSLPPVATAPIAGPSAGNALDTSAAPMTSQMSAMPHASNPDVFADLFGEGALPLTAPGAETTTLPSTASRASTDALQTDSRVSPTDRTRSAHGAALAEPDGLRVPHAMEPASAPMPWARSTPPSAAPTPHTASNPAAVIDWDTALANAPRWGPDQGDRAGPSDPLAADPFEHRSQAERNPADPLAGLAGEASHTLPTNVAPHRDPLALFSGDPALATALSDPRPTVLREDTALRGDTHPAAELFGVSQAPATATGPALSDHASEVHAQFMPPAPRLGPPRSPSGMAPNLPRVAEDAIPFHSVHAAPPPSQTVREQRPPPLRPHIQNTPSPLPPSAGARSAEAADAANAMSVPEQPLQASVPADPAHTPSNRLAASAAVSPQAQPQPPKAAATAFAPAPDADALREAFFDGAGISDLEAQQALDAEGMRRLGRLMRAFTDGTLELLSSRAMLKREVRAEITMIVDEENNPFKILPNGRAVLMQMFGARMPGFISPEAAVHDALADLHAHQLGMMAGMRAALLALLDRFNPQALEQRTPHDGGLGEKWLPGGREARLWREMQQLHTKTTAAVQDDFQAVFGKAFQEAYDQEMDRLREERRV